MNTTLFTLLMVLLTMASAVRADDGVTAAPPAAAAAATLAPGSSTNEPTIVTSERLHVDYLHNIGTFEDNVLAVDPRMTARADKMIVFFGGTNTVTTAGTNSTPSVQKIIAEGGVVITTPDNKISHSDHAEYTAADGKVVLTGNPRVESSGGVVTGLRITIWHDSQKMDVVAGPTETNRTKLIVYPEDQRKKE